MTDVLAHGLWPHSGRNAGRLGTRRQVDHEVPIDKLKLDRSFVLPMVEDARALALVAAIIDLAHGLGLRMLAEGVETDLAYAELRRLGCDQVQGFSISRPLPAAELDHWLSNRPATDKIDRLPQLSPSPALV